MVSIKKYIFLEKYNFILLSFDPELIQSVKSKGEAFNRKITLLLIRSFPPV